jgi:hypothetical protein
VSSPSGLHRMAALAAALLLLISIVSAILSKVFKIGCKRTLFCLLVSAVLLAQLAVIDFHDLHHVQLLQPAANGLALTDIRRFSAANGAAASNVSTAHLSQTTSTSVDGPSSLYDQFLRRYSSITGAMSCTHFCKSNYLQPCPTFELTFCFAFSTLYP